jgi:hypothetical protein
VGTPSIGGCAGVWRFGSGAVGVVAFRFVAPGTTGFGGGAMLACTLASA